MKLKIFGVFTLSACLASAINFEVSTAMDESYNGGTIASETADGEGLSLREAIELANLSIPDGDSVSFNTGAFAANANLILINSITILDDLAIDGNIGGLGTVSVQSGAGIIADRIFIIDTAGAPRDGTVTLSQIVLENGSAVSGGAILIEEGSAVFLNEGTTIRGCTADDGGGVFNSGRLSLNQANFEENAVRGQSGRGGAIFNATGAGLAVEESSFSQNRANRSGGAIEEASGAGSAVRIQNSTFNRNSAGEVPSSISPRNGGAIHVSDGGSVMILRCEAQGNTAANSGGAYWNSSGVMTIRGGTIVSNQALGPALGEGGGGVYNENGMLTIDEVSISQNRASGTAGSGGAIYNSNGGAMRVNQSRLSRNIANFTGGGIEISSAGETVIVGCQFTQNRAFPTGVLNQLGAGVGGGIHATGETRLNVETSSFIRNAAMRQGGAIWNSGESRINVINSTLVENAALLGGGIYQAEGSAGSLNLGNTTISRNFSSNGAGIFMEGASLTCTNVTIAANDILSGSPVILSASNGIRISGGTVRLVNTIIADNSPTDVGGSIASVSHTLLENGLGASGITNGVDNNIVGVDPLLEPLASNGGPTSTHAFPCESVVRNAGSDTAASSFDFDQRGALFPRIYAGNVDMGAFELQVTTYDDWAATAFNDTTSAADRAPDANPDGDGRRNGIEYLTGSDPENDGDNNAIIAGLDNDGNLTISYDFVSDRKEGSDGMEVSSDLVDWTQLLMPDRAVVTGSGGVDRITVTLPSVEERFFGRLFLHTP